MAKKARSSQQQLLAPAALAVAAAAAAALVVVLGSPVHASWLEVHSGGVGVDADVAVGPGGMNVGPAGLRVANGAPIAAQSLRGGASSAVAAAVLTVGSSGGASSPPAPPSSSGGGGGGPSVVVGSLASAAPLRLQALAGAPSLGNCSHAGALGWEGQSRSVLVCPAAGGQWVDAATQAAPPPRDAVYGLGASTRTVGTSCLDVLVNSETRPTSGSYALNLDGNFSSLERTAVYCDMDTDGGGWTLVMRDAHMNNILPNNTGEQQTPFNSPNDEGKLSDAQINRIKSVRDGRIGYRVTSGGSGTAAFFPGECEYIHSNTDFMAAPTANQRACTRFTTTFSNDRSPSYTQCGRSATSTNAGLSAWFACGNAGNVFTTFLTTHRLAPPGGFSAFVSSNAAATQSNEGVGVPVTGAVEVWVR